MSSPRIDTRPSASPSPVTARPTAESTSAPQVETPKSRPTGFSMQDVFEAKSGKGGQSYTIQSGDTLSGIASRFGTTVGAISSANGISNPNRIYAGQVLSIPGAAPATPPPAPQPPPQAQGASHTVQPGDTLSAIAAQHGSTVDAIASANGISNPNRINVGQVLTIPGAAPTRPPVEPAPTEPQPQPQGSSYTVQPGDTLSGIAGRHGTTVGAIASANGIADPNRINVGQVLTIPGAGPVTPPVEPGPVGPAGPGVSMQQLRAIMPNLSQAKAEQYLPHLNAAMAEANINTPQRQAAFLAQLAHESGEFRWMEELASGAAYEGRADLGNTQPGDGVRFKGRGPIQLTGRSNYIRASEALGIDLVNNPTRAADPDVGFRTAAWYWSTHNLNAKADRGDFDGITRAINGGYNGKASRDAYYAQARGVLGA